MNITQSVTFVAELVKFLALDEIAVWRPQWSNQVWKKLYYSNLISAKVRPRVHPHFSMPHLHTPLFHPTHLFSQQNLSLHTLHTLPLQRPFHTTHPSTLHTLQYHTPFHTTHTFPHHKPFHITHPLPHHTHPYISLPVNTTFHSTPSNTLHALPHPFHTPSSQHNLSFHNLHALPQPFRNICTLTYPIQSTQPFIPHPPTPCTLFHPLIRPFITPHSSLHTLPSYNPNATRIRTVAHPKSSFMFNFFILYVSGSKSNEINLRTSAKTTPNSELRYLHFYGENICDFMDETFRSKCSHLWPPKWKI